MIRSAYLGISGMINHQTRMDVIGNNISNVNTTGFKSSRANFQDALYQAISMFGAEQGSGQVGTGVTIAGISNNFSQGPLQATGRTLDLAISGPGFFGVKDENDRLKFTRDGTFFIDKEGYLVNTAGLKVVDPGENPIKLELEEDQSLDNISISETGEIFVEGESLDVKIGLFKFQNVSGLTRKGNNLFLENNTTGERTSNEGESEGFGTIHSGFLEMSNIDLARELTDLITTQRGYQANARVFITADEVLRDIIELKR